MTIFIDDLVGWRGALKSAHLGSDKGDDPELHEFAQALGLNRAWFQNSDYPHYDVFGQTKFNKALALGATKVSCAEWITKIPRQHRSKPGQAN